MQQKIYRDIWKLSQIREIIYHFKRGNYGDDEVIATTAALKDIIMMAEEDK